jgi:hypothetical protein
MARETEYISWSRKRKARLWLGLLLPPAAWAFHVQAAYLASEYGCLGGTFAWNHVITIAAAALSIAGGATAFSEWRDAGAKLEDESEDRASWHRFIGQLGMGAGALFTLTIIAQWLPTIMGVSCEK